ncbi:MAG: hypothetical protein AVDCRST_MAG76-3277, partial [uncultured Acidimicrobiales bacterium]
GHQQRRSPSGAARDRRRPPHRDGLDRRGHRPPVPDRGAGRDQVARHHRRSQPQPVDEGGRRDRADQRRAGGLWWRRRGGGACGPGPGWPYHHDPGADQGGSGRPQDLPLRGQPREPGRGGLRHERSPSEDPGGGDRSQAVPGAPQGARQALQRPAQGQWREGVHRAQQRPPGRSQAPDRRVGLGGRRAGLRPGPRAEGGVHLLLHRRRAAGREAGLHDHDDRRHRVPPRRAAVVDQGRTHRVDQAGLPDHGRGHRPGRGL